ncbi:MAG: hypothetical protein JXB26_18460 [Candidatus Aminicenantes bacterium]|nr:hypothetical protein [Candidatus Aminicenantes bacterium]
MDQQKYKDIFDDLIYRRHGVLIDFDIIETRVKDLRLGGALSYDHLLKIGDDNCWPFSKYWMWPCKEQIEDELKKTDSWFVKLPENEKEVIGNLDGIFKNIALVSIILRFVCPEQYAIYSRPPLLMMNVERGKNDVEEYVNYVNDMRILKKSFKVEKTADVDIIVWAISHEKDQESISEFKKLLASHLPGNIKPEEIIYLFKNDPIKIAGIYLDKGDYKTAGMWAGKALEKFVVLELNKNPYLFDPFGENTLKDKINRLCRLAQYQEYISDLHLIRRLRNKAMHEDEVFEKKYAKNMVNKLMQIFHENI